MTNPAASHPPTARIRGLDLARALALLGMVIVNYELSMGVSERGPAWLGALTAALQGRAAGTFVFLAGIGASLGSARARNSGDAVARRSARTLLLRRGAFLFVLGCLFLGVWPADILHFYGVYLALGAGLLFASRRVLVAAALASALGGLAFLVLGNWSAHWNFAELRYLGLWTPWGFLRNLFLDGWHPVLPWFALYLAGMLVGRAPLTDARWRRRILMGAGVALFALELCAELGAPSGIETPGWNALLATTCIPPTPAYLLAACATALLVVLGSCELAERLPARWLRPLEATGRLALSFYLGHVLLGLGTLESLDRLEGQSLAFAVLASLVFFAGAVAFACVWTRRFELGPFEALMRRLSDGERERSR